MTTGFDVDYRILLEATKKIRSVEGELELAKKSLAATKGLDVWAVSTELAKAGQAYLHPSPGPGAAILDHFYDKILELGLQIIAQFRTANENVVTGLEQVAVNYTGADRESAKNLDCVD